jgi:hypothetical protein
MCAGAGNIVINGKNLDEYFKEDTLKYIVNQPLVLTNTVAAFDLKVNVDGGQLWIKIPVGMTFSQPIDSGSDNENIKRILINMTVEYLTV